MIKKSVFISWIIFLMGSLFGSDCLKQIDQWNHGDKEMYRGIFSRMVDKDGDVIVMSDIKRGVAYITPKEVKFFASLGEGPDNIGLSEAMSLFNDDIAFIEVPAGRVKIFTKKNNSYAWKETKWLKPQPFGQLYKASVLLNNKWFVAGMLHKTLMEQLH